MTTALNEELLKGNLCFGCGPDNPEGLRIRIFRDGTRTDRLVGIYRPRETAGGFPHSGRALGLKHLRGSREMELGTH